MTERGLKTPIAVWIIAFVLLSSFITLTAIFRGNGSDTLKETEKEDRSIDTSPAYGDTIIVGSIGEPSILIPMLASDSASHEVAGLIFNGLIKFNKDLSITGDLAKSWEVSKDGLTITFHLRHDVKWQDGVPFTSADVMFGYRTIIEPRTPTAYKEDYLQVKEATAPDPYTFRVMYEKPFAPALTSWGDLVVLPEHILKGKDITKTPFGRKPIGTGPFRFVEWKAGDRVILEANPDYFEGRPYLDRYVYKIIPDQAAMFLEAQALNIDWIGLTPLQFKRQTNTPFFMKNFRKYRYPTFAYTYLGFNLKDPRFADKRVRKAIAYGIDKEEILEGVLFGLGSIATGPYVPNTWPYNPNVKRYRYDPERARRLLKEAGWRDTDGDGILDKDGRPFEFTILTNQGNSSRIKTATIIQWRLRKIGIKVKIRTVEWATFINEFVDKRRFEAIILGWSIGLDPDQYDIWHSSKTGEKEFNFVSYKNPEVDQLLEKGRRTFDIEERKRYYFRMQEILADDLPYVFLYVPDALTMVSSRFYGIEPAPIGIGYNLHKWYVPKPLQRYEPIP